MTKLEDEIKTDSDERLAERLKAALEEAIILADELRKRDAKETQGCC